MDQISLQTDQKVNTNSDKNETSEKNLQVTENFDNFEDQTSHKNNSVGKSQHSFFSKILNKRISLNEKDEVQSLNDQERDNSEQMDIDEQNDIVNQLSFIENLNKNNIQDDLMNKLSTKDRLIHANSKKYQGNQFFKEHNLEQAIQSYKIGLSLLNPECFSSASESDYLLMAELTSNILYNMGTCYFILMSFRHAIKYYDQALLIKPNYLKAIHNRALCHFQQGNIYKAYQDIEAAIKIDSNNMTIQNDFLKIEDEYLKIHLPPENGNSKNILHSNKKNRLARSMIQNKSPKSLVFPFSQTGFSMINCEKIYSQIQTKSQQQIKPQQQDSEKQTNDFKKQNKKQQVLRKRLQSLHRKKLFLNSLKFQKKAKNPKFQRFQTKKQNKFRPYILNRSTNLFIQDQSTQDLDKKVQPTNKICSKRRVKTENLQRGQDFDIQRERQKYWNYIPIMVATGFGLYHGIRAVLGK